jgi:predicted RNase H-like nuclease (RuvC/YqgF family)
MKGKSGQQIGKENVQLVTNWIAQRNVDRDWHEYEYDGRVNRSALAEELEFAPSVCTQNKKVRKLIEDVDKIWFLEKQAEKEDKKSHGAARERAEKKTNITLAGNNLLTKKLAVLEAENKELRQKLAKHKKLDMLVQSGAPGFKA